MRGINTQYIWLCALIGAAFALRLYGIGHGYPSLVTGDERPVCKNAVGFLVLNSLEPEHFNYPELYSYLFAGAIYVYYVLGGLWPLGDGGTAAGFTWFFFPGEIALIGRILSAGLGALTVGIVWLIGRHAYGIGAAWGGALFTALSVSLVHQARYALPDIAMVFWCQVALFFLLKTARAGDGRSYALSGLFIGLAISTKYNAGMLCFAMVAAHLVQSRCRPFREKLLDYRIYLAVATLVIGFLVGSPYWIIFHEKYMHFLRYEGANMHFNLAGDSSVVWSLLHGIVSTEWAWGLLGLAGCGYALYSRSTADWIALSAVVPTLFYIGSWPKSSMHYIAFILPLLGLLGARLIASHANGFSINTRVVLAVLTVPNLWFAISSGHALRQRDVRIEAAEWIETHIPNGASIGVYSNQHGPILKRVDIEERILEEVIGQQRTNPEAFSALSQLRQSAVFYRWVDLEYSVRDAKVPAAYRDKVDLSNLKTKSIVNRDYLSYDKMKELGVEYVVLPASAYSRFLDDEKMPPHETIEFYHYMRNRTYVEQFFAGAGDRYEPIQEFIPYNGDERGKIVLLKVR